MAEPETITDNQTDVIEDGTATIDDIAELIGDAPVSASEEDGAVDKPKDEKAPEDGKSAPEKGEGTTDEPENKGELLKFDGIEFDATAYGTTAKAKGYWDGESSLNVNNIFKQNIELEKKMHDLNTALGNYKTQTTSLQAQMTAKATSTPKTREEIKEGFKGDYSKLESVYNIYKGAFDRAEDGEEKETLRNTLIEMEQKATEMDNKFQEALREYDKAELRKELGIIDNPSDVSPEKAKEVANANFDKVLTPEQIADKEYINKIISPAQRMLHRMASAIFPSLYDAGNPTDPKSLESVHRVMMDQETVQMAVQFGDAMKRAEEAEQKIKDAEKASYDRGLQDGLKGVRAKTPDSTANPVKDMTITKEADADLLSEVGKYLDET